MNPFSPDPECSDYDFLEDQRDDALAALLADQTPPADNESAEIDAMISANLD